MRCGGNRLTHEDRWLWTVEGVFDRHALDRLASDQGLGCAGDAHDDQQRRRRRTRHLK
jgi:hypothetical protein